MPLLDAAAGHHHAEHLGPMVAPGGTVDLRRATKFAGDAHQRRIEQAATIQVANQRRKRLIERRNLAADAALDVVVHVPATVGRGDEPDAGLDQATRQQQPRTRLIATVLVANLVVFLVDVERFARLLRTDHRVGSLIEGVDSVQRIRLFLRTKMVVDRIQQTAASRKAIVIDTTRQIQIANLKVARRPDRHPG